MVQDLHEQVDRFQVCQLVVSHIDTQAEVKPSISPVDHLVGLELHEYKFMYKFPSTNLAVAYKSAQLSAFL